MQSSGSKDTWRNRRETCAERQCLSAQCRDGCSTSSCKFQPCQKARKHTHPEPLKGAQLHVDASINHAALPGPPKAEGTNDIKCMPPICHQPPPVLDCGSSKHHTRAAINNNMQCLATGKQTSRQAARINKQVTDGACTKTLQVLRLLLLVGVSQQPCSAHAAQTDRTIHAVLLSVLRTCPYGLLRRTPPT